jgi:hypothetical protein
MQLQLAVASVASRLKLWRLSFMLSTDFTRALNHTALPSHGRQFRRLLETLVAGSVYWRASSLEIDESSIHIGGDQLHSNPVANINTLKPVNQFTFDRWREKPNPCSFGRSTGDNAVKLLSESRFQKQGSRRFADLPFNFVGSILFLRAVCRQNP